MTPLPGLPGGEPYVPAQERVRRATRLLLSVPLSVFARREDSVRYGLPWPDPVDPRGPAIAIPELEVRDHA